MRTTVNCGGPPYGAVFTVPETTVPATGARVMDLRDPGRKMSKSDPSGAGVVFLLDGPDVVARKIDRVYAGGAERCRTETAPVLAAAREAVGLS
jgi:tryptophanyl-tRNA synthetase